MVSRLDVMVIFVMQFDNTMEFEQQMSQILELSRHRWKIKESRTGMRCSLGSLPTSGVCVGR